MNNDTDTLITPKKKRTAQTTTTHIETFCK